MANILKLSPTQIPILLTHINRTPGDGYSHSNTEIDESRTKDNYTLIAGNFESYKKRAEECFYMNRKNAKTAVQFVITLPKEVKPEDERTFFSSCLDFLKQDFGDENIYCAVVHKDETRPHLHVQLIPVDMITDPNSYGGEQGPARTAFLSWLKKHPGAENAPIPHICARERINLNYLKQFHARLEKHLDRVLGYPCGIRNGATKEGNKTIDELKAAELEEKIASMEKRLATLSDITSLVLKLSKENNISPDAYTGIGLIEEIANYRKREMVLRDIIRRNGIAYTRQDLEQLAPPEREVQKPPTLITEKKLSAEQIRSTDPYLLIIEATGNGKKMESPQREHLFQDLRLEQPFRTFLREKEPHKVLHRIGGDVVFVRNDSQEQLMMNLLYIQQLLREEEYRLSTVYAERMKMDEADLLKSVLDKATQDTVYSLAQSESSETERQREQEAEIEGQQA